MTDPLFMSPEHVAVMNARLGASEELARAAAGLTRSYVMAYRLTDARTGRVEHWVLHFAPHGVWFSLEPSETADLTFVGDYQRMIDTTRSRGDEDAAGLEVIGDTGMLDAVADVFALAHAVGAVPVTWPEWT
jgi:hypothetical protein